jgi:hypothetical protein
MAGRSRSRALMEVEKETMLNEVLDDEILSNYSSDDDSASDYDYIQLSDGDNEDVMVQNGLEELSTRFVWENTDSFPASRESFFRTCGPQFDTADLDVVSAFVSIFDISLVQLIVDETNRKYRKSPDLSHFALGFRSGKMRHWTKCTWFWLLLC